MGVVDVEQLSYKYGRVTALRDLSFSVPEGAMYALLGANGSGKTTLLQILTGLRRPQRGQVRLLGGEVAGLTTRERQSIGYIAEGQELPGWMRLEQLEAYLSPLYPTWDPALARSLRERFSLDQTQRIRAMSRGAQMKVSLLCALAPRPRLLVMDEPFTGMDALVKDDLVRGLLDSAGSDGWSVLLCSHDIGELELLADWVGFLDAGRMRLSEPMEAVRQRFKRVELVLGERSAVDRVSSPEWMCVERAGQRMTFVLSHDHSDPPEIALCAAFPDAVRIDVRDATLRELFVALARPTIGSTGRSMEVSA